MTNKERVHAALEGGPVDRYPVTVLYSFLYHMDHFAELTGLPQWEMNRWLGAGPDEYAETFKRIHERAPFEILQPQPIAPPREWRENQEFVEKDGRPFRHDRKTGEWVPLDLETRSGHAFDDTANQTQFVFDMKDADEHLTVTKAEARIAEGANDYIEAVVAEFGEENFILSGGVAGTLYSCHNYVGLTNLFAMLIEEADLIDYLCKKILEQNIETIRRLAAAGGDAIYVDDATSTCDMISVDHYERFSLPYVTAMVDEIHSLGQKAIVIYFGGIADRREQIASTGADGLLMETSMKGYLNDIAETVATIGDRVTLFANIDPVGVLQNGTDGELEAEITRQAAAGAGGRGFLVSIASPITPSTPLRRVRRFIELGREIGAASCASVESALVLQRNISPRRHGGHGERL